MDENPNFWYVTYSHGHRPQPQGGFALRAHTRTLPNGVWGFIHLRSIHDPSDRRLPSWCFPPLNPIAPLRGHPALLSTCNICRRALPQNRSVAPPGVVLIFFLIFDFNNFFNFWLRKPTISLLYWFFIVLYLVWIAFVTSTLMIAISGQI